MDLNGAEIGPIVRTTSILRSKILMIRLFGWLSPASLKSNRRNGKNIPSLRINELQRHNNGRSELICCSNRICHFLCRNLQFWKIKVLLDSLHCLLQGFSARPLQPQASTHKWQKQLKSCFPRSAVAFGLGGLLRVNGRSNQNPARRGLQLPLNWCNVVEEGYRRNEGRFYRIFLHNNQIFCHLFF